jgi:2-hydroxychromene-2-carboxylate isomerase
VKLNWRPVSLMEVFPESGGLPLSKRHPSRQRYRILELQRWREKRELNFNIHPQFWPFDPTLADCVACALAAEGVDPQAFIGASFVGTFEQQRNLADETIVAAILAESGYDSSWLEKGKRPEAHAAYHANRDIGLAAGVFGSPSYVLNGEVFWGQDRLDLLNDALTSGRKSFSPEA